MKFFYTLFLALCLTGNAHAANLPPAVLEALRDANIPLSGVGIVVREVNAKAPLISINASKPMNPASTMKLLTTSAGLELLTPAYSWQTEAYLDGKLEGGVLQGNLVLKGYGDPKLTLEQFWLWLRELRSHGLREIRGNLVLDRSAFQLDSHDPAAFDSRPQDPYNVGPDALLLNCNAVCLRIMPQQDGGVEVVSEPDLGGIHLENRLTTDAQATCATDWEDNLTVQPSGDSVLAVSGVYPLRCGEKLSYLSPLSSHDAYFQAVFRALWKELGGAFSGELRTGTVPANATLFSTHYSPPLAEVIRDINKYSNNVMARQLFLTLGLASGQPATIASGELVIRTWLAQQHISTAGLVLENGAGLSREERIPPQTLAAVLHGAYRSQFMPEYMAALPILGVDGTMRKRLPNSMSSGYAHLKSGSLHGVKAIAGYVQSRSGKRWVTVFLINHPNASAGQRAEDALVEWIQRKL